MDVLPVLAQAWASVSKGELPPPDVTKLLVSKLLGYVIILGSCIVKVPQIRNVVKSGSAEGLSALSGELEALALLIHTSYGFLTGLPFSAYGEAAILASQSLLLLALIYRLQSVGAPRVMLSTAVYTGLAAAVLSGRLQRPLVEAAFNANTFLFIAARVPQIIKAFRERSTGQLSLFTFANNLVGCCIRIYTTLAEGAGAALLRLYLISLALNTTIVSQILIFGDRAAREQKKATATAKKKD